jgi:hypothetical protein
MLLAGMLLTYDSKKNGCFDKMSKGTGTTNIKISMSVFQAEAVYE